MIVGSDPNTLVSLFLFKEADAAYVGKRLYDDFYPDFFRSCEPLVSVFSL